MDSWLENAAELLASATREVDVARVLQSSLEALLKQTECDTRTQVEKTNRALDTRVQQTRTAKQTLEDKLSMVRQGSVTFDASVLLVSFLYTYVHSAVPFPPFRTF